MLRMSKPIEFVKMYGIKLYSKQYNAVLSPALMKANKYYEENYGPDVHKEHITSYIQHWGIKNYIRMCSPLSTYASVTNDIDFLEAQMIYLSRVHSYKATMENAIDEMYDIGYFNEPFDPYRNRIQNLNGELVPEPYKLSELPIVWLDIDEDYIYKHGIVHFMLRTTCKQTLCELLSNRPVATWQQAYIDTNII